MIDQRLVEKAIAFGAGKCSELVASLSKNGSVPCPHDFETKVTGMDGVEVLVIVQVRQKT